MDKRTYKIVTAAVVGAVYAALTIALMPISFGMIQFRISEVLCILPFFMPCTAWGLFIGCALANLISGNIIDVIFGSLATLFAALAAAYIGKRRRRISGELLACLMPVLFNGVIVGAVITAGYNGMSIFGNLGIFAMNCGFVALGEAGVLFAIGYPLMRQLPKKRLFSDLISKLSVDDTKKC